MHDLATLKRLNGSEEDGLPVNFLTAVITKASVAATYPGGVAGFRRDHPHAKEDPHLFALVSMSGHDLQARLDALAAKGLDLAAGCAVADMMVGPLEGCLAIEFFNTGDSPFSPRWRARAAPPGRFG